MHHHLRHTSAVVLSVAALTLSLTACSTNGNTSSGDANSFSIGTDDPDRIQPVVDAFEAAHPGVTIDVQSGGNSYIDFLRTRLASNSAPDVFRTFPGAGNTAGVLTLDEAGSLEDLSAQSWTSQLNEQQQSLFATDGKVLSVPIGALALGAVYDDQTLEQLGASIPETYSDVLALCSTAAAQGKVAFALYQKGGGVVPTYSMVAPLVYGPDPSFTATQLEGGTSFSDSGWVDAFSLQQEMAAAGCFQDSPNGTDWDAASQQVARGDAVATFAFSDTTALEAIAPEGTTFSIAPFPTSDDPGERYLAVADSNGFGVNAASAKKDLANQFVEYLATAEAQNLFANASKGAPSLPNDSFVPDNKNQQTIADYQKSGMIAVWPDQEWPSAEVVSTADQVIQALFNGGDTPQTATQKLDEAFDKARK